MKEAVKKSFMCALSIKVPIRKKSGNLFNDPEAMNDREMWRERVRDIRDDDYIYVCVCVCVCVRVCVCVLVYVCIYI